MIKQKTPTLLDAVKLEDMSTLTSIIEERRNQYNLEEALLMAIKMENAAMVKTLLDAGADPDFHDGDGITMVQLAATFEFTNIVQILLEAGADLRILNGNEEISALQYAIKHGYPAVVDALNKSESE
ncbi:ankyrin repeat domain-containing protein [Longirhabdus pacifica]|uniref:ankyrin repeat domain-containing protein n=1 Tax=Longirhabdus pacifica TaxID=2305227 RepID=UPI0013E8E1DD|nr:ankyrin repeat domain-containing protein [Longirhabdus pacifica]